MTTYKTGFTFSAPVLNGLLGHDESGVENQDSDYDQDIPITNLSGYSRCLWFKTFFSVIYFFVIS
jgi:hypothetical protein